MIKQNNVFLVGRALSELPPKDERLNEGRLRWVERLAGMCREKKAKAIELPVDDNERPEVDTHEAYDRVAYTIGTQRKTGEHFVGLQFFSGAHQIKYVVSAIIEPDGSYGQIISGEQSHRFIPDDNQVRLDVDPRSYQQGKDGQLWKERQSKFDSLLQLVESKKGGDGLPSL